MSDRAIKQLSKQPSTNEHNQPQSVWFLSKRSRFATNDYEEDDNGNEDNNDNEDSNVEDNGEEDN